MPHGIKPFAVNIMTKSNRCKRRKKEEHTGMYVIDGIAYTGELTPGIEVEKVVALDDKIDNAL